MEDTSLQQPDNNPAKSQAEPVTPILSEEVENSNPDSVLLDVADMSGYDKNLKRARIWLYLITGMQIMMGIFESTSLENAEAYTKWIVFGIDAGLGLIFLACALWSYKKPYAAFNTALVFYLLITVGGFIIEPANINFGIFVKIFVVITLIRAIKDARELEDLKNSFNIYS